MASETEPRAGKNLADQMPASSATSLIAGVPPKPAGLNSWFAELKRRRVIRALVGYGIAAFAVLQVIEPIMHGAHWPESILSYVVAGLAAGFPIVVAFAWIFDVKAGRIERTASAPAASGLRGVPLALVVAAIGVLAAAPGTFWYFAVRKVATLTERDSLLLADFVNTTGEPVFDGTLKQALAVKLDESPFLNVVPDQRVRETLRLMNRSPDEHLTTAIAREVCERQGIKAMLTGSIASLGSTYVIALDAVNCRTGDSLARDYVEAGSKDQVLKALGQAASTLRRKLGESLSSIQKFDAPIEGTTTASLEALKYFTLGEVTRAKGPELDAIPFYERAINLDPNFALAYAQLGTVYGNAGEIDKLEEYLKKAFELRDRVTERERLYISGRHYFQDLPLEATKTFELWKRTYPRDWYPRHALAVNYRFDGHPEKALEEAREALRLNPNHTLPLVNLADLYFELNRLDEAKAVSERAIAQGNASVGFHSVLYRIALVQRDPVAMQKHADWARGKPGELAMLFDEGLAAVFSGQLKRGEEHFRRASELALQSGLKERAASVSANQALLEAACGNVHQAQASADSALRIARSRNSLREAAIALVLSGDTPRAQTYVDELARRYPTDFQVNSVALPQLRAAIEIKHGNPSKAIELLKASRPYGLGGARLQPIYVRGQAYLGAQQGKEAATEFQRILDHRGAARVSPLYALAYLGLARAWAQAGDTAQSRRAYQDFLALWKDADPDVPILIEAKAEYARLR